MEAAVEGGACLNCGLELAGAWCAHCGQRAVALRPTLHELLHEAFHEFAHFDGKILRTLKLLLFAPGALTAEFLGGKRARSVTPIRLYLLCSVLFFGLLTVMPGPSKLRVSFTKGADAQLQRAAARANKDPSIITHAFETALPKAMFILMPLFGLIVFAFYWRAERMFVPHFYFAVHIHAFAFVMLALFEVTGFIHGWWRLTRLVFLLALFPYLFMALRRVYGGGRWLTAAKMSAIVAVYGSVVVLSMAALVLFTLRHL
jgi:hypothetical protein